MANDKDDFGDGDSKFNKSIDDLHRISNLQDMANQASCQAYTWEGLTAWRDIVGAINRELVPYLTEKELSDIDKLKVKNIPPRNIQKMIGIVPPNNLRDKIDLWQQELNICIRTKGMGIIAEEGMKKKMLK